MAGENVCCDRILLGAPPRLASPLFSSSSLLVEFALIYALWDKKILSRSSTVRASFIRTLISVT